MLPYALTLQEHTQANGQWRSKQKVPLRHGQLDRWLTRQELAVGALDEDRGQALALGDAFGDLEHEGA